MPSLDGLARKWGVGSVTDSGFTRERATDVEHVVSALRVTKQKVNPRQIDDLATPAIQDSALRLTGLFSPRLADTAQFMAWNMTRDCVAPTTGTHHLADFYAVHAHESPQVF